MLFNKEKIIKMNNIMKNKYKLTYASLMILLLISLCTTACSKAEDGSSISVEESDDNATVSDVINEQADENMETVETSGTEDSEIGGTITDDNDENPGTEVNNADVSIVWIGDSLTQGSLGHDNDNLDNAPFVKLAELSGCSVEGYGFYGHVAHDVIWLFRDEDHCNQPIDPDKVYILWIGLNDWATGDSFNVDTQSVMAEIDAFLDHDVDKYIVIGATARYELRENIDGVPAYKIINDDLIKHYGSNYLDVIDVITEDGFGPDNIHLNQDAYDRVAEAVYNKLCELGYTSAN